MLHQTQDFSARIAFVALAILTVAYQAVALASVGGVPLA